MTDLADALAVAATWPAEHAATAVVAADGRTLATYGDQDRRYPLASVTKPLAAYAILSAVEEGALELDAPAGPEGSTVRHLLAHTAGYDFNSRTTVAQPGARRIYSNTDFDELGELIESEAGMPFGDYLRAAVLEPLGMRDSALEGSPAADAVSTAADLARFAAELQSPTLLAPATVEAATTVQFPGLRGVLPGFGSQEDNQWGLGFEIRANKSPHWTGANNSPATYGHFGQSGTFLWVDPEAGTALVALTDRNFGPWAAEAWPAYSDGVLAAAR
ncbi:serine hydrolase [Pseudoclavibacter endophyticus]|uniref:Beta-lactamase family protein n=1 Tax=Pseudoclavibacter endophyticus TaxID=1778590 RepID=A0A6H9WNM7_9MICO|nr:serine hydrolase domain-containing protein [Pseudoclavibacter endophyticus]KAB1648378.1 beta-lactamase family protein [Pseudoclavibacter endophyticus]GGA72195.1 serine hydrolase [Pseudoclavibacter endophyticus]